MLSAREHSVITDFALLAFFNKLDFLRRNFKEPVDKYYQEFKLFVNREDVKACIKDLRKTLGIDTDEIRKRLNQLKALGIKNGRALPNEKKDTSRLIDECWDDLYKYVNSKISYDVIDRILQDFGCPASWDFSVAGYILMDVILSPSKRVESTIDYKNQVVIVKVSPEAKIDDIKEEWPEIERLQSKLKGYQVKYGKRFKPKLDKKLQESYDMKKLHKIAGGIKEKDAENQKKINKFSKYGLQKANILEKHNPESMEDKRNWNRMRKTYQRYKKYV